MGVLRNDLVFHLMEHFRRYESLQMGELIRHMGQLHGFHELLLKIIFHRQLDVFNVAGAPVGFYTLLNI